MVCACSACTVHSLTKTTFSTFKQRSPFHVARTQQYDTFTKQGLWTCPAATSPSFTPRATTSRRASAQCRQHGLPATASNTPHRHPPQSAAPTAPVIYTVRHRVAPGAPRSDVAAAPPFSASPHCTSRPRRLLQPARLKNSLCRAVWSPTCTTAPRCCGSLSCAFSL